jgi:hypothetical protein
MALPLPPTLTSFAYTLEADLQELPAGDAIHRSGPDESSRDDLVLRKLGKRGWERLNLFRFSYQEGWGESSRPALSPRALEAFSRFIAEVNFPHDRQPSIFLTDEGGLELVWEDAAGQSVQVEFRSKGIKYYRAMNDEEGEASFGSLKELARRLSA